MLEPLAPRPTLRDAGAAMPDPEVRERPVRRTFTAEYKLRIVEEANAAREPGAVVALLRREGLYSSHLVEWRRLYRLGGLHNLAHPRGRPPGTRSRSRTSACAGGWPASRHSSARRSGS